MYKRQVKDLSAFRPGLVVADAVYNPEETKLLREAKEDVYKRQS